MCQTAPCTSLLVLILFAIFHTGGSWVDEGLNEQFYALSAVDATGHDIPMSSYVGKVMWHLAVGRVVILVVPHTISSSLTLSFFYTEPNLILNDFESSL